MARVDCTAEPSNGAQTTPNLAWAMTLATSVGYGTAYTASYDAAGDMVCRAPTSAATCGGSPTTGQQLGYDNERQLASWQNQPTSPTTTASYAYDGEGNRVAQKVTASGTAATTRYLAGGLEDVTISGSTTTLTKYESVPGVCSVVIVGSGSSESISYVATDGLGSVSEALDSSGHVTAQQLYGPYGAGRYSSGAMSALNPGPMPFQLGVPHSLTPAALLRSLTMRCWPPERKGVSFWPPII